MKKINKPWGYELIFAQTKDYVGKILHINAGHRLSRQYHNLKEETFLVQSGELTLEIGDNVIITHILKPGDNFHCPPLTVHRMIATATDVDIIEVSTPHLDDVVRLEDEYGR